MRKLLILTFFLLIGGSIAALYYYTQQATEVPKWYQLKRLFKKKLKQSHIITSKNSLKQKILNLEKKQEIKLQLSSAEINDFIKLILLKELGNEYPKGLPEGIQAQIENNKLEVGGIVNISDLSQENMSPYYKGILEKLVTSLPQFANRDIYLGIQGHPVLNDEELELSKDSLIKIGNLSFTQEDLAKITGLSQKKIQEKLALKLKFVKVKNISIEQDKLNLTLSKK